MASLFDPPITDVRYLVEKALVEDLTPFGDLTSTLIPPDRIAHAEFISRESGVVAGTLCVEETFTAVDTELTVEWQRSDGDHIEAGDVIGVAAGRFATLLTAERTALNFMSHLSGIASNAARWVDLADGRVTVWDTRKTLPGYRSLQKAAVRAGGARNHRGNLSDWIMIKDNHLSGISLAEGVKKARDQWPGRTVHVEVDTKDLLEQALAASADIILLDNFTPTDLTELVAFATKSVTSAGSKRPLLEASGGINFDTLDSYAATGVDLISSGALTNSAGVLDIGLDVVVNNGSVV